MTSLVSRLPFVFETLLFYYFCDIFLKGKKRHRGSLALMILLMVVLHELVGIPYLSFPWRLLLTSLTDIVVVVYFFQGRVLRKTFVLTSFYGLSALFQALFLLLFGRSISLLVNTGLEEVTTTCAVTCYLLVFLSLVTTLHRVKEHKELELSWALWLLLQLAPALSIVVIYRLYPFHRVGVDEYATELLTALNGSLLSLNLLIFVVYHSYGKSLQKSLTLERYRLGVKLEKKRYTLMESTQRELRETIHDYRKHLIVIQTYLQDAQLEAATAYLSRVFQVTDSILRSAYTGNPMVDIVLSGIQAEIRATGISFAVSGALPEIMGFDSVDISILLSNAVHNAVEACVEQGLSGALVAVSLTYYKERLLLQVTNPYTEREKPKRFRVHRQSGEYGLGVGIMKRVSEKYAGRFSTSLYNHRFTVSCFLQEPRDEG